MYLNLHKAIKIYQRQSRLELAAFVRSVPAVTIFFVELLSRTRITSFDGFMCDHFIDEQ